MGKDYGQIKQEMHLLEGGRVFHRTNGKCQDPGLKSNRSWSWRSSRHSALILVEHSGEATISSINTISVPMAPVNVTVNTTRMGLLTLLL